MANSSNDDPTLSQPPSSWPPLAAPPPPGPGRDTERLAVAAHLHLLLRRRLGRVTDIEWMARNDDYAREIVRLALADPTQADLVTMAHRLYALLPAAPSQAAPAGARAAVPAPASRYLRSLR